MPLTTQMDERADADIGALVPVPQAPFLTGMIPGLTDEDHVSDLGTFSTALDQALHALPERITSTTSSTTARIAGPYRLGRVPEGDALSRFPVEEEEDFGDLDDADILDCARDVDASLFQLLFKSSKKIAELRGRLEENGDTSPVFSMPPTLPGRRLCDMPPTQSPQRGYPSQSHHHTQNSHDAAGDSSIEDVQKNLKKIGKKMREAVRRSEGIIRETDDHIERERERIARKYPVHGGQRSHTSHI